MRTLYAWIMAGGFGLYQTAHFGWHFSAGNDAEMICDGITGLLCVLAMIVSSIEHHTR